MKWHESGYQFNLIFTCIKMLITAAHSTHSLFCSAVHACRWQFRLIYLCTLLPVVQKKRMQQKSYIRYHPMTLYIHNWQLVNGNTINYVATCWPLFLKITYYNPFANWPLSSIFGFFLDSRMKIKDQKLLMMMMMLRHLTNLMTWKKSGDDK